MGRRPYWPSRMEVSYCTFGFGAIIRRDLRTLSLRRDSFHLAEKNIEILAQKPSLNVLSIRGDHKFLRQRWPKK